MSACSLYAQKWEPQSLCTCVLGACVLASACIQVCTHTEATCTMYLSLCSSVSNIFCSRFSTHTQGAFFRMSPLFLSPKEKTAYSPVTPPVSSCARDRCSCSGAVEMFHDFSHLKHDGFELAAVSGQVTSHTCTFGGCAGDTKELQGQL